MIRSKYATDLNNEDWDALESLVPQAHEGGHPRSVDMRGIFERYILHLPVRLVQTTSWMCLATSPTRFTSMADSVWILPPFQLSCNRFIWINEISALSLQRSGAFWLLKAFTCPRGYLGYPLIPKPVVAFGASPVG